MVTLGTEPAMSGAKGYVERTRSDIDRRGSFEFATKSGRLLYRLHRRFHHSMLDKIIADMSKG